ncbi:(deoxy)nucleoside triphosphate pyrophosphohydrolase [Francisella noatunensis]|uniref:8-oxo-dGTP diphosphatase n=1 Tax=Francisella noatunensis TaxID=657445 RepID=A0A9Q2QHX7_9GAMM|nr:(deoxy)nucleoside triphosphate pyrophosphohydrolase [Francisella noatunensis]MBK2028859.1 (deoxy)nucleoside triphosphate pyrophosphohydrolase [Francisella noatunensis]MBK2034699.1 (deoxy)nucleoside triphosphate pyrophosphohydrolase [Francisella noatunensis]MBK2049162.1 (deoxy)nucleoside triphosphate pyrophosphohydrolase [Francisella noatunensis]MBK2050600.1 (deoxy)nucleoside triphosphate pyrophosphohydrolase [Francisella noatunensis]MBK2051714.1 (deoxy)nucleoside triphosphate pyrophosphohyd
MKKNIRVSAAVIKSGNEMLCIQRGDNKLSYLSYKFEFPGGKVEENEHPRDTVMREVQEELKMNIIVEKEYMVVEHEYPDFFLKMYVYICSVESRELQLTEHISYKWLMSEFLHTLDWAEADILIVNKLIVDKNV